MEALGNGVVPGEAPHAANFLGPFGQGFGEGSSGLEAAASQGFDRGIGLVTGFSGTRARRSAL